MAASIISFAGRVTRSTFSLSLASISSHARRMAIKYPLLISAPSPVRANCRTCRVLSLALMLIVISIFPLHRFTCVCMFVYDLGRLIFVEFNHHELE